MADVHGKVWAFGINTFGQLGLEHLDKSVDTSEPTMLSFFNVFKIFVTKVVASTFGASFAIDNEGKAYRWGTNQV
jgi:alpha-tubulin suppressor-like RCC1 family protein